MLVFGDATSWVIDLLCYNARQFITLLNIRGGREVVGIIEPPRTIRIQLSFNGCNGTNRAALQEELRTSVLIKSEVILIFGKCTYMAIFFFLELPYTFNNTFTTFEIYFH